MWLFTLAFSVFLFLSFCFFIAANAISSMNGVKPNGQSQQLLVQVHRPKRSRVAPTSVGRVLVCGTRTRQRVKTRRRKEKRRRRRKPH
ncbi:hypothetical protein BDP27DRAFT_854279 [Rhodocollybia butyracea]|uniref:Secreted protein n=1 Tax=Rhodocollybia butyracea TaxID=206335 RepID=A0A9P5PLJ0_9AGAR|nr:hypothetical protein BDP27DRAFT_854279 [Rhodocollybia butyracea]